ncbi:MAG: zinc-binding dehydrogenase, partial [Planctomycetes bacterium]|nr:zinc-binding dehydrogenase [Planctomycetota bacterium]
EDSGEIQYEVYTESDNEDDAIVHSQGVAEFKEKEEMPPLNIQDLLSQMLQGTLNAESCYKPFKEMGIEYGEGYRVIREIYQGENQLLARLCLPVSVKVTQSEYVLHPSLMDSALQSSIGLMLNNSTLPDSIEVPPGIKKWPQRPSLPFALESLEIVAPCTSEMYAWVRYSDCNAPSDKVQKLDIDLCDGQGNVCVKMRGLTLQELEITSKRFEKMYQDQKTVELSPPATDFGTSSSIHKPKTVELKSLSELEANTIDSSLDKKRSQVGLSLQTSQSLTASLSPIEALQPDPSPQTLISKETLQEELKRSLAKALYIKESGIDIEKPFIDMGLDSIVGVEWIKAINEEYKTNITATKVYDYPNIKSFAYFLKEKYSEETPSYVKTNEKPIHTLEAKTSVALLGKTPVKRFCSSVRNVLRGSYQNPGQPFSQSSRDIEELKSQWRQLGDQYGFVLSKVTSSLDKLEFCRWMPPEPEPYEVTIQVKASAINFPDSMCVRGLYPTMPEYPFVPGFEVSGVISKVGSQVTQFQIGDPVIAMTGEVMGGHASFANVPECNAVYKPANISYEEACSFPVVFGTVHYAFELGELSYGESVLIQTATGGCGLMALQLAALRGAVSYGTTSKEKKAEILRKLEVPYILDYRSEFDQKIDKITQGRGVDVVLNMLSGDGIQRGLNCLAPSGRYLEIAVHALKTGQKLDLSRLVKNQTIYSIDLRRLGSQESQFSPKQILSAMNVLVESGQIVPIVSRIYPIYQMVEALNYVAQGNHIGKVVMSHTRETMTDMTEICIQNVLEQRRKANRESAGVHKTSKASRQSIIPKNTNNSIAIIGRSGQFPQSGSITEFWENLSRGRDCITEVPKDRWSIEEYYHAGETTEGKTNCKWMGTLKSADKFDPLFFNISPAEAEWMDPQQRVFLENAWSCIEDAGINPETLSSSQCGVFVGCGTGDYGQSLQGDRFTSKNLMGASSSILSARISYLLNLKGPCLSIDTACSSSLVAIAEACGSLVNRTSNLALSGGVCVLSGPSMHIMTSQSGMLSKDGRCFTCDARANGFVPGEGVGVILLKRLEDALRDKDPIHGIIRGWGVNQDGKTNGITAPSVNSQIQLEREVYQRFGIDPATISLVEAHGTGTKLGDPIEVEALIESLQSQRSKKQSCALGSVKGNIGHLLAAAGVSGVIKVLLCLEHQKLVPQANFQTLNPHIDLNNSRFYINTKLQDWKTSVGIPRRACISSFGYSGTNAHLVIEESQSTLSQASAIVSSSVTEDPLFIPLSAKNRESLRAYVEQLYRFLQQQRQQEGTKGEPRYRIEDIAYTLQVGRSIMEERVVFMVKDESNLLEKLQYFLANDESVKECYLGSVKSKGENLVSLLADEDMSKSIVSLITKKRYSKLMKLWVNGLVFDWNLLYKDSLPDRIHLPTYPFARERYWITETQGKAIVVTSGTHDSAIHPLLHENTSDLSGQRFASTFTGKEFFLNDHKIKEKSVLSGVCYLEMARAAVEKAAGETEEGTMCLKDVVWAQPIIVDGTNQKVQIWLFAEESGHITYEVYTESDNMEDVVVHSHGSVEVKTKKKIPPIDIEHLKTQMNEGTVNAEDCYHIFKKMGIEYGKGHQGVREIYRGRNQLLAKLSLPTSVQGTLGDYVLHPSLMDSALQSSIGLMLNIGTHKDNNGEQIKPALPFALETLEILSPCTSEMYGWVRYSSRSTPSDKVQNLDIDLCDKEGNVCVQMRGLSLHEMEIVSQDQKTVELSLLATDFGISSSVFKPKAVELKRLSGLEAIPNDLSLENRISQVGLSLQPSHTPSTSLLYTETQQPDPSPQPLISKETLQEELKTGLAKALYMKESDIDEGKPFIDMGLDSIIGVEWIKAINQEYGTSVSATKVYDHPTIQKFALFLEQEIKKISTSTSKKASATTFVTFSQAKGSIPLVSSLHRHIKTRRKPHPVVVNGRGISYDKIAIVGMSGRYPDAYNLNKYWDNLVQGKNSIREIPQSRWDVSKYYDPDPANKGKVYCKWLGMLDNIDCFDPLFFQISPAEAEVMDPQHRLFLEEGYKAFEDAGYSNSTLNNKKCGVYLGIMSNEYSLLLSQGKSVSTDTTGNSYAIGAARIAYHLNLKGPAIPVDTACSSSLVAIHLACQALLNYEIDMALAGGVSLYLTPESYLGMCQAGMLSPEGQCKTFDDSADGFVPGEGVGTVVLKRLKDAERDNDSIYGV